jgi:hypothetical protein
MRENTEEYHQGTRINHVSSQRSLYSAYSELTVPTSAFVSCTHSSGSGMFRGVSLCAGCPPPLASPHSTRPSRPTPPCGTTTTLCAPRLPWSAPTQRSRPVVRSATRSQWVWTNAAWMSSTTAASAPGRFSASCSWFRCDQSILRGRFSALSRFLRVGKSFSSFYGGGCFLCWFVFELTLYPSDSMLERALARNKLPVPCSSV